MVVVLAVAAAGDVVAVDAPLAVVDVVAGEQRDDGEALHGQAEVVAQHGGEPVGLALHGQQRALDLLVVLELDLEELDQLDRQARAAGDARRRSTRPRRRPSRSRGWRSCCPSWPGGRRPSRLRRRTRRPRSWCRAGCRARCRWQARPAGSSVGECADRKSVKDDEPGAVNARGSRPAGSWWLWAHVGDPTRRRRRPRAGSSVAVSRRQPMPATSYTPSAMRLGAVSVPRGTERLAADVRRRRRSCPARRCR